MNGLEFTMKERVSARRRTAGFALLLSSAAVCAAPAHAADATPVPASDPAPAAATAAPAAGDIIVTAQKRPQKLQDVPISIAVISGSAISDQNYRTLQDLSRSEPAFTITPVGRGVRLALRGVSSGTNSGFDQSVVTFIDDVYHGKGRQSGSLLLDIDSIELLKGPQTAYFGNNAIAGAINVQTAKPTMTAGGSARALYGSQGEYAAEGVINAPLTSTLAVRVAGLADGMNGYLLDRTGGGWLPHERNYAGRVSALWAPTSQFKLVLKAEATRNRNRGGAGFQIVNCPPLAPFTTPGQFCPQIIAAGGDTKLNDIRDQNTGQQINLDTQDYEGTATYDLDKVTLTSVTAYNHFSFLNTQDLDGSPLSLLGLRATQRYKQFSQELRLASNNQSAPLTYIIGGYFQTSRFQDVSELSYGFLTPVISGIPAFAPLVPNLPFGQNDTTQQHEQTLSGFGTLTWHVTDKLSITGAARETQVKKSIVQVIYYGQAGDQYGNVTPYSAALAPLAQAFANGPKIGQAGTIPLARTDSKFTPSGNIQYKIDRDLNVYASYAEGFKAGGFNGSLTTGNAAQIPFNPEYVKAYEIGVRSQLFDRRLLLNVTGFISDYKGLQESIYAVSGGVPISLVQNAASSVSQGVEVETKLTVSHDFSVGASLTFLDSHFKSFPNAATTVAQRVLQGLTAQNLTGRPLAYAPKFAGLFYATYMHPINDRLKFEIGADLLHQSSYFTADQDDPALAQGSYYKLDMHAAIRTADGRWELSLIGKNVTNTTIINSAIDSAAAGSSFISKERPRSFAGQISYKW